MKIEDELEVLLLNHNGERLTQFPLCDVAEYVRSKLREVLDRIERANRYYTPSMEGLEISKPVMGEIAAIRKEIE